MRKLSAILISVIFVSSCVEVPEGITPVSGFKLDKYMGKWYEIARLDHRYERHFNRVSVEYSLNNNGDVLIKKKGYMPMHTEWREKEGKATLAGDTDQGFLKVSYIFALWEPYVIFKLDPDYEWAYVCGKDRTSLWLLARTPEVNSEIREDFIEEASRLNFDTSQLNFVHQSE